MENLEEKQTAKQPSRATEPDLDWSQIRETVLLLNLSIAHINNSMSEGDESINTLSDIVTSMLSDMKVIGDAASSLPDGEPKQLLMQHQADLDAKIREVVIHFQFYDKLVQRLHHASHCLADLSDIVDEPSRLYNPFEWKKLQTYIESKYTVESDKVMFEALRNGASIEEAIELAKQKKEKINEEEEAIELF